MAGQSFDPNMSPLGPAVVDPAEEVRRRAMTGGASMPAPMGGMSPLGPAPAAPVQATPLAADVGVPPMLAAPQAPQGIPVPMGPAPGMLMRTPGSYTPGGMRQDSVEAVSTPGAAAAIDQAEALYGAAGQLGMAAQRELAATANAQAAAQDAAAAQQRQLQAELESRERARQARVDAEAQRYIDGSRAAEAQTLSLARASRDAVSTPLLALAQYYMAGAAAQQGRPAPDLVGAAIDRQLQQQRAAYEDARTNAAARMTTYGRMREMGADAREADIAFAARSRADMIQTMQTQLARITDPAKRAAAAAEITRQQAKAAADMAELRGKVGDKVTKREKYQAAQSSGGGYMVATVMPDGTTQYLPIAVHKQYTEAMGQDPGQRLKSAELGLKYGAEGLSGRKLAAETTRAEAEARKAVTGENPEKEAEKASANAAAMAAMRDIRAKMEAAGWKFGKNGVEREGKELPGLGVNSSAVPDFVRRRTGAIGLTDTIEETARMQSIAQSGINQYLKAMSGQGVTAGDIPRLQNETATTMGSSGEVTGTRDPRAYAEWILRSMRDLKAQQDTFSPEVKRRVEAEQAKLDRAINGGK